MNTMRKVLVQAGVVLALLAVILGCRNPFQVGLGDKVDLDVPDVALTSHPAGEYLSGTVTLGGVYTDDFEISGITLSFDDGTTLLDASFDSTARTWQYVVNTADYPDGEIEVLITITDQSGKDIQKRILYYFDNTPPLVMVKNPQGYASNIYNGTITVRGESADVFGIDEVVVRILDAAGDPVSSFDPADGTNSWVFEFDSRAYFEESGTVRLEAQATDRAGNQSTTVLHYDDVLFENSGAPITIEDLLRISTGTPVAGTFITADEIQSISLANIPILIDNDLDKPTVNFVSPNNGQNIGGSTLVTGTAYDDDGVAEVRMRLDLNGDGDYDDSFNIDGIPGFDGRFEVEADWELLTGTILWTQDLNLDGELYQVEAGHDGRVVIQVRAMDINGLTGNPVEIAIRFDDTIPRVESLSHVTGNYVRGTFTLTGSVQDDERVDRVRISYDGGISYVDMFQRGVSNDGSITEIAPNNLSMAKVIDTSNIPGQGAIASDPLYLRLLVIDNASYQALTYITLNVDNTMPTGAWDSGSADPQELDGTAALLQGTATDLGTISGIAGADVYFVRGTDIFNFNTDTFVPGNTFDFGDGDGAVRYLPTGTPNPEYFLISIDDDDEAGSDGGPNGDGDGYNESLTSALGVYTWSATFDSNQIPDGTVEIHYVVNDSAGNRNHYVQSGFIKNNRPVIDLLTVGTDLDFSGAVEGDETAAYSTTLSARQRLYVNIDATDAGGGISTYEVRRVSDDTLVVPSTGDYNAGAEIDISGETESATLALYALVTDTDGITARQDFDVFIDNVDTTNPGIAFDTITNSSVDVAGGHVESSTESLHDNGTGDDADVSGTINLTGEFSDDQRIQNVYLAIEGYTFGGAVAAGAEHLIAYWDTTPDELVSNVGGDLILTPTWDVATGHTVGFSYTWDTSEIGNVAENDITLDFRVEDFGPATTDATANDRVDVVPYITGLEIGLENGTLSYLHRSALGAYPIAESNSGADTFRINGYNLDPGAGGVTIGADSLTEEAQDTTDYLWVDVRKDSAVSGDLTVTTSGVPSINNSNSNALTQNQEAAPYYPDRNDNRYVSMWGINTTAYDSKTEAVMRPNATRTGMDWYYVNNGQDVYFNATRLTYSWSILGGDMTRNDDGTLMWIYLHNMNWFSGQTNWGYWGSVQWGKDETYEAQAYNWHRANRDRLGLGNLSFSGDPNYGFGDVILSRYKNLQIVTDGTNADTDNYVAYFDTASSSRAIVFWSFRTGTGVGGGTTLAGGWTSNLEKVRAGADTDYNVGGTYLAGVRTPFTGISRTAVTSGGNDSEHFDLAWDDGNGRLYLAYYDSASSQLKLAYNDDPAGTPAGWTTPATPIDTGAGQHVDMIVDPDGGVHLAYFDGAGSNLKYAYISDYDGPSEVIETYTVDALFTNGMYNSIAVRDFDPTAGTDYRPVISGFSLSYSGTRYPVRVSWPTASIGSLANGANSGTGNYTGAWEVITVPATNGSGSSDSFVETDGATIHQGQIVVGYNGSFLEAATLYSE